MQALHPNDTAKLTRQFPLRPLSVKTRFFVTLVELRSQGQRSDAASAIRLLSAS